MVITIYKRLNMLSVIIIPVQNFFLLLSVMMPVTINIQATTRIVTPIINIAGIAFSTVSAIELPELNSLSLSDIQPLLKALISSLSHIMPMVKIDPTTTNTSQIMTDITPTIIRKNGSASEAAVSPVIIQVKTKNKVAQPFKAFPSFGSSFLFLPLGKSL